MVAKQRDMVSLSFLVHASEIPEQVRLKEHSLSYVGQDATLSASLVTGVYGAHSKQTALVSASNWSRENGAKGKPSRILMVDVNYRIDNYALTREQARPDLLAQTGWLHMDRIASSFRDEIRESWVDQIVRDQGTSVAGGLANMSLVDIAARYPKYVALMMKKDKSLRGVVHPVHPSIDSGVTLWVATVRYDKERFEHATVRYLPQVNVII